MSKAKPIVKKEKTRSKTALKQKLTPTPTKITRQKYLQSGDESITINECNYKKDIDSVSPSKTEMHLAQK